MGDLSLELDFRNQRYQNAQLGLEALGDRMSKSMDRVAPILASELRDYLNFVTSELASRHSAAWPGGTTDKTLSRRSGALTESLKDGVRVQSSPDINSVQGSLSGVFYARTHEFGAVIKAKNAKYLTIPLPAALNANGTPKRINARAWDNTFVMRAKTGSLLICQRQGKTVIPLYVLKKEVKIKPRLGMGDTLKGGMSFFQERAMLAMLREFQA